MSPITLGTLVHRDGTFLAWLPPTRFSSEPSAFGSYLDNQPPPGRHVYEVRSQRADGTYGPPARFDVVVGRDTTPPVLSGVNAVRRTAADGRSCVDVS